MLARAVVEYHGCHHQFIGLRRRDQRVEPCLHRRRRADRHAGAVLRDARFVDRGVVVGRGIFRRGERQIFALGAAHDIEVDGLGEMLGLLVAVGADHMGAENGEGLGVRGRGTEIVAVEAHGLGCVEIREVMRERKGRADLAGELALIVG